jgi:HEAT repeat protein
MMSDIQHDFSKVMALLAEENKVFPPNLWNQFSDLSAAELSILKSTWDLVSSRRKNALLQDLAAMMNYNYQVNFDALAKFCLNDDEPEVRANAIRLLDEYERRDLIDPLLDILLNDADDVVQSEAATVLGNYVYKGELEELPQRDKIRIEDALLQTIRDTPSALLQRRALEAISYSSRDEIAPLILAAYEKPEREWKASALFSMGRSANRQWEKIVLANLDSDEPDIQFEAIGAVGEMYIERALPRLLEIAEDFEDLDQPIRMALGRALENIGGMEGISVLSRMLEWAEDDEEIELLEQAIEFASFTNAVKLPDMFGFSMDEMDDAVRHYHSDPHLHDDEDEEDDFDDEVDDEDLE